jgi:hypothetical protein
VPAKDGNGQSQNQASEGTASSNNQFYGVIKNKRHSKQVAAASPPDDKDESVAIGNQKSRIAKIKKAEQVMAQAAIESTQRPEVLQEQQVGHLAGPLNASSPSSPAASPRGGLMNKGVPLKRNYILVLDLDETLVHFKDSRYLTDDQKLKVRPGVGQFLEALHPYYRFIVFTAAQKMYADFVIQKIDPQGIYIEQRFYRDHCKQMGRFQVKDLNLISRKSTNNPKRQAQKEATSPITPNSQQGDGASAGEKEDSSHVDLNKIIIIDNLSESFQLQPLNGIKIRDWFGNDFSDRHLLNLIPLLKGIVEKEASDVRMELSKYRKSVSGYGNSIIG